MYFIMLGQMVLSGEKHMANWALEGFLSSVDFLLVAGEVACLGEYFIAVFTSVCPRCPWGPKRAS